MKESAYDLRIRDDDFLDAFTRESLFSETTLDVVEDLSVRRVRFVECIFESKVSRTETVAEVLREDPAAVCIERNVMYEC